GRRGAPCRQGPGLPRGAGRRARLGGQPRPRAGVGAGVGRPSPPSRLTGLVRCLSMATATRLTSKGQVVIPKAVRDRLRWAPGTELAVEEVGTGAVRLSALATADPIDRMYGCLRAAPRDPLAELEAEHRAEIEADEHRRRRGR